jgi:GTP-binding protein HflX
LDELASLIDTAGGSVTEKMIQSLQHPDNRTYIGQGKVAEIKAILDSKKASFVVFDDDLSPSQQRNLEKELAVKVLDRSSIILEIFSQRAQTREARLQVELAQLEYTMPRLTRMWTHLDRSGGGAGTSTKGIGETQIEVDRRLIKTKISFLKSELKKVRQIRETQRKSRSTGFNFSLVGYTNAGKSTLLQLLSSQTVYAADKLFATLDPLTRKVFVPELNKEVTISDTVGFIAKLPHHLIEAFKATLEEVVMADALIHVVDISHPQYENQIDSVFRVLEDLGCATKPVFTVLNKADLVPADKDLTDVISRYRPAVLMSAIKKESKEKMLAAFYEFIKVQTGMASGLPK